MEWLLLRHIDKMKNQAVMKDTYSHPMIIRYIRENFDATYVPKQFDNWVIKKKLYT